MPKKIVRPKKESRTQGRKKAAEKGPTAPKKDERKKNAPNTPHSKVNAAIAFPELPIPKAGDAAPEFSLPDQFGAVESLVKQRGKWVLVYFYPKDDTPGCTKEACMIRDGFPFFEKLDVTIFGISVDSIASHKKFAEKHRLPFTLLSDEKKEVVTAYGAWGKKKFMGHEYLGTNRISFLIDPKAKIAKVYPKVDPATHADEVLSDLRGLRRSA